MTLELICNTMSNKPEQRVSLLKEKRTCAIDIINQ
jgi:hypothetical protein